MLETLVERMKRVVISKKASRLATLFTAATVVAGCVGDIKHTFREGQLPVVKGPAVTDNSTPFSEGLVCVADKVKLKTNKRVAVTVGGIRDYTGKYSEAEGGSLVTQGGSLMVISALGKMGDAVVLRERFDTQVADIELAYTDNRRLGDGRRHQVGEQDVPWLPYSGGSILKSDVYIVGGITELNFNINSGGAGVEVDGIGGGVRTFAANVGVDLRLVNSSNLNVLKVVSLQKQVIGYEVNAGIFSFFGTNLFDIQAGVKNQEPLQLAVRSVMELGTMELVAFMYGVDYTDCLRTDVEPDRIASTIPSFYSMDRIQSPFQSSRKLNPVSYSTRTTDFSIE